jgi:hypothetical protein
MSQAGAWLTPQHRKSSLIYVLIFNVLSYIPHQTQQLLKYKKELHPPCNQKFKKAKLISTIHMLEKHLNFSEDDTISVIAMSTTTTNNRRETIGPTHPYNFILKYYRIVK